MNKQVVSWAGYDFANTIFSMNVVSRYFPIFVINVLGGNDLMVGVSRSAAMVIVAFTMPILGVIADQRNQRKLPMIIFTIVCCILTALLTFTHQIWFALLCFCFAIYSYEAALVYYNALMPAVAAPDKLGYVSGIGVAFGYVGSITGLFMVSVANSFIYMPYIWTAILFLGFSIPTFVWVKDYHAEIPKISTANKYQKGLIATLKRASKIPGMIRLLVGRFFVIEAMETVILFMAVFLINAAGFDGAAKNRFGLDEVTLYLIAVTFCTVIGSYIWGILAQKFGSKTMLLWAVSLWIVALMGIIVFNNKGLYYLWGSLAGTALGGVWTTERPILIHLVGDNEKLGEYFGLYALSGRLAAVVGPIIWGLVIYFAASIGVFKYRLAILALLVMLVVGLVILWKIPDSRAENTIRVR
ncbi:MAG: MFS transporter [candidate division Zixibacteria bacterium]|jgi:UMF1 family MFS transporter|nr:MFS transporter [candidate division Zixibacteria bacterium]